VLNYVDRPTVTGNPNGNLFTDWSSYFPREVVECGLAIIEASTAFCRVLCIKVITYRRAASVIATFSLTNATYNFSFVDCSVILPLKQKRSAQQSLSSLHLQLPSRSLLSKLTADTRQFRAMGQRAPEVNKVALTAFKYFIALISATIIS